jgi:copper chaperone CopZ
MKKIVLIIGLAVFGFSFSAEAQSCCNSKAKDKTYSSEKTASKEKSEANGEVKAMMVSKVIADSVKTEKFTVYGNCGMCEKTIEGSLKDVKGVSKVDWDKETDEMSVTFNPEVITHDDIKQKIADVGYDSDSHRAKDEVYNSLPGCCQYDRPIK